MAHATWWHVIAVYEGRECVCVTVPDIETIERISAATSEAIEVQSEFGRNRQAGAVIVETCENTGLLNKIS